MNNDATAKPHTYGLATVSGLGSSLRVYTTEDMGHKNRVLG